MTFVSHPAYLLADAPGPSQTVLCVCDGPGATWRISFELPLRGLRGEQRLRLLATTESDVAAYGLAVDRLTRWLVDEAVDVLVLSRANGAAVRPLIRAARSLKIATIYFLDDDLLAVPDELGAAKTATYREPARLAAIRYALAHADIVYASTRLLGHRLRAYAGHVAVASGEMYCAIGSIIPPPEHRTRCFGYMGTAGHAADLAVVADAIHAVLDRDDDVEFMIFGTLKRPSWLSRWGQRVRVEPGIADYDAFLVKLATLGWSAALAPLKRTPFNMTKANTKFIEYTAAALPTVASAGPVYAEPIAAGACLSASTTDEWTRAISILLDDAAAGNALVARAQGFAETAYAPTRLSAQVEGVIEQALETVAARG